MTWLKPLITPDIKALNESNSQKQQEMKRKPETFNVLLGTKTKPEALHLLMLWIRIV